MTSEPNEIELLQQADGGDQQSWGRVLETYRDRLRRMVRLRMDRRVQARLDASDVIQEAFLEASNRLAEYLANPQYGFVCPLRCCPIQRNDGQMLQCFRAARKSTLILSRLLLRHLRRRQHSQLAANQGQQFIDG